MKAIYVEEIFGQEDAPFNGEPATVTVEADAEAESATLRVVYNGATILDLPLSKDDLRALDDLIPSEYEFKNMREEQ